MKLSQKIMDFNVESATFMTYIAIPENTLRLRIAPEQLTEGQGYKTDWDPKLINYTEPATHNGISILAINLAYDVFHGFTQGMKKQIKNNQAITLLAEDYKQLNIHEDLVPRDRVPRPVIAPQNSIQAQSHLRAQIFAFNPNPPHQKEIKFPTDVKKLGRKVAITKVDDPAPALAVYHNLEAIGSTVFDLIFATENVGSKFWLMTFYINSRGEEGPMSVPIDIIVS